MAKVNIEKQLLKLTKQCNLLIDTGLPQDALHASVSDLPEVMASNYLFILEALTSDLELLYLQSYFYGKKDYLFIEQFLPRLKSKICDYEEYLGIE